MHIRGDQSVLRMDSCLLFGMVHLPPLPGSARWAGSMTSVLDEAVRDAERLIEGGCDGLIVENMGDVPYLRGGVDPETVAAMAMAVSAVQRFEVPVGLQILAGANREALGVAAATGAHFIRAEAFAYAHVADEGWLDATAGPLLRQRAALDANVEIWADVQKKHSAHAVTGDLSIGELARGTAFCGADALIVTGNATGDETALTDVDAARTAGLPVVIGSGVTKGNVAIYAHRAAAVIVGSDLKMDGEWKNPVEVERVKAVRQALDGA